MKIHIGYLLIVLLSVSALSAYAQQNKTDIKTFRIELHDKAIKDARKEAKTLEEDGWYAQTGALPLEKQIERAWMKEVEINDNGLLKYFIGTGSSFATSQANAKANANTIAKENLINSISSEIANLIEAKITTEQLSTEDVATVRSTISTTTKIISQKLAKIITLTEIYRKQGEEFECQIRIAYSRELAKDTSKQVIIEWLQQEPNFTYEKLELLMNF